MSTDQLAAARDYTLSVLAARGARLRSAVGGLTPAELDMLAKAIAPGSARVTLAPFPYDGDRLMVAVSVGPYGWSGVVCANTGRLLSEDPAPVAYVTPAPALVSASGGAAVLERAVSAAPAIRINATTILAPYAFDDPL